MFQLTAKKMMLPDQKKLIHVGQNVPKKKLLSLFMYMSDTKRCFTQENQKLRILNLRLSLI